MAIVLDSAGVEWLKWLEAQVRTMESTNIYMKWGWKNRDALREDREGSGQEKETGADKNSVKEVRKKRILTKQPIISKDKLIIFHLQTWSSSSILSLRKRHYNPSMGHART